MIIVAEVKRDEQGYWTHPALIRNNETAKISYWLRTASSVLCDDNAR